MKTLKFENNEFEIQRLKQQLEDAGIDTSVYGKDKTKSLEDLLKEIKNEETTLEKDEEGKLMRKVQVGNVEISYINNQGEKFILREDKQVFNSGEERKRKLSGSLSGKIKSNEKPEESIIREIQEELGIESKLNVTVENSDVEIIQSPSYPGLTSQYTTYRFTAEMEEKDFNPEGYIEKTDNLTTYFIWEKIN